MPEPLIHLEGVQFAYSSGTPVLDGIDLVLRDGERIGLVGSIGCGKTTLLHLIVGLLGPRPERFALLARPAEKRRISTKYEGEQGWCFNMPTINSSVRP